MAHDLSFSSDDASFLCTSDQVRRYSSGYLAVSSVVSSSPAASYVQARDNDSFYLFTPATGSLTSNVSTPSTLEHRDAGNQVLQALLSYPNLVHAQVVLSADQHRLAMYSIPSFYVDLP